MALVNDRDYVVPEDIKAVAVPVLGHRLVGEFEEVQKNAFIQKLLDSVALPTEDWSKR
jgi:MoxR-like ATPase